MFTKNNIEPGPFLPPLGPVQITQSNAHIGCTARTHGAHTIQQAIDTQITVRGTERSFTLRCWSLCHVLTVRVGLALNCTECVLHWGVRVIRVVYPAVNCANDILPR